MQSHSLTSESSLKAASPYPLQLQRSKLSYHLGRCCHMRNELLQQPREQAPSTGAMPHEVPDDGHEAITKSPYHRSVKRQATERSTAPSLVATLPDELLLKVLRCSYGCLRLPCSVLHPNTMLWTIHARTFSWPYTVFDVA